MKYRTYHTFETLKPEFANDVRRVASNCNAIMFRALDIEEPTSGGLAAVGSYDLRIYAPRVNGVVLLPPMVPAVQIEPQGGFRPTVAGLYESPADMLVFDAGHPDALDSTVYEVRLYGGTGGFSAPLMVIRRFMTPV